MMKLIQMPFVGGISYSFVSLYIFDLSNSTESFEKFFKIGTFCGIIFEIKQI